MDKEEFKIKLEQINHLVEMKDYKGAMEVVDSIDWRRVKNVRTLCVVGEIYAANKRYEDARDIFLLAYHRSSIGKNILVRLFDISIKLGDIEEATDYYEEFKSVAPTDNTSYVLHYKLLKAKKADVREQIAVLEEYKKKEFTEKWSFELAKLYFESGEKQKSIDLCNEMILWFSEGNYVMKALDLKMRMGVMTEEERKEYEKKFIPKLHTKEDLLKKQEEEKEEQKEVLLESEEVSPVQEKEEEIIPVPEREEKEEKTEEKDEVIPEEEEDIMEKPVPSRKLPEEVEELEDEASLEVSSFDEEEEEEGEAGSLRIGRIRTRNQKEMEQAETFQERISKGLRDLFGVMKKKMEASRDEDDEEEDESEEYEELNPPKEKETSSILIEEAPELEKEGEEKNTKNFDFARPMKMPELSIPHSMRRKKEETIFSDGSKEESTGKEETSLGDFNLEDAIIAAASAQGIKIPEKKEEIQDLDLQDLDRELARTEEESSEDEIKIASVEETPVKALIPDLEEEPKKEVSFIDSILSWEEVQGSVYKKSGMQPFHKEKVEGQKKEILVEDEKPVKKENPPVQKLTEEEEIERFINSIQPQEEREPEDIIPREKELTEDEKKLFSYFIKVPGLQKQIVDALVNVQEGASKKHSKSGNVIVMGGPESGKTRLISSLIPAICKMLNLSASKVAYVFAEQINGKDIDRIFRKLAGGFFVIEKANQLDQETVDRINTAMERNTGGMIVILEDDKIGMRKFVARYQKLARKFTAVINIPVFTNDELANFARVYAMENGYRIDNMGMLALYNLIGMSQQEDIPMNVGTVKNMVDAAISKSQGGLFRKSSKKKMDRDGYIVLHEKDFNQIK